MAEDVRALLGETLVELLRREAAVLAPAGARELHLRELPQLLHQLEQEPVVVAVDASRAA